MPGVAIIGAQWGDEGKGKVVDALANNADFVVRYSGGANAGHTIVVGNDVFKLHHLPCGVLHDQPVSILGGGMVVDPWSLLEELEQLASINLHPHANEPRIFVLAHTQEEPSLFALYFQSYLYELIVCH